MKKDDLIKSILSEAEDIEVPELSERARMEPIATLPAEVENRPRTKRNPFRALTLVVLLIMGFGFYYNTIMRPATKITIDINPSIELTLNSHDVVIGVSAFNDEGDKFLDQSNFLHKPLNMAIDCSRCKSVYTICFDCKRQQTFIHKGCKTGCGNSFV